VIWVNPSDLPFLGKKTTIPSSGLLWNDNTEKQVIASVQRICFAKTGVTPSIAVKPFIGKVFPTKEDFIVTNCPDRLKNYVASILEEVLASFRRGF